MCQGGVVFMQKRNSNLVPIIQDVLMQDLTPLLHVLV